MRRAVESALFLAFLLGSTSCGGCRAGLDATPPAASTATATPGSPTYEIAGLGALAQKPLVILNESQAELQARVSGRGDVPIFTLYEDGLVIFQVLEFLPNEGGKVRTRRAEIGREEAARLAASIATPGFLDLPDHVSLVFASDMPAATIAVRSGNAWKRCSIYGIVRPGEESLNGVKRDPEPPAFVAAYGAIVAYEPKNSPLFEPSEIAATLSPPPRGPDGVTPTPHPNGIPWPAPKPWPANIPAPPPGIPDEPWWVSYKHTLDRKYEPALVKFMGSLRWDERVLFDGRPWSLGIAWRVPSHGYIDKVMTCKLAGATCN